jgi:Zn-dependent protease
VTDWLYTGSIWILPLLFAITFHEAAHGFAALRFGDDTAARLGRVSANPLRHVDPFGTVVLPGILLITQAPFLFGWAKPVPVNFWRLHPQRLGMILVAAAGPATNLVLALASALLIYPTLAMSPWLGEWVGHNLLNSVRINIVLAVFNMLPIPPLDGGRVAVGILPRFLAEPLARMERLGILVLLGALFLLPMIGNQLGMNLDVFSAIVGGPAEFLEDLLFRATGLI